MKPMIRYRRQLLFRKSNRSNRMIRIRPAAKLKFTFRPMGFGQKPRLEIYEYATD
jgi:hypothetical protein